MPIEPRKRPVGIEVADKGQQIAYRENRACAEASQFVGALIETRILVRVRNIQRSAFKSRA